MGAGVEDIAALDLPPEVVIASASGLFAAEAAEHAIAGLLALARGLTTHADRQREHAWSPFASRALAGRSLAIVGLGAIGTRVARAAAALGMRPLGVRRTPRPTEHVAEVGGPQDLHRLLGEADHLVVCAPLTAETRGLVDARALACLHRAAWVVNVARGGVVDEPALLEALREGRVGGAFLDVFEEEPLPPTSRWWTAPNVIVTPHVAGLGVRYLETVVLRLLDNVGRLGRGEPPRGAIVRALGY
jgi:phosphoglycerate dehydrogenase-like enzyme